MDGQISVSQAFEMVEEMSNIVEWATKEFFSRHTQMSESEIKNIVEQVISPKGIMKRYFKEKIDNKPFSETLYFEYLVKTGEIKISEDGKTAIRSVKQSPEEILKKMNE
ncbi:MAG: hypothetical protein K2W92_02925 [Alphaproteobacteria bacterium]|nr:hypothetical protein [Alphaproteobacteria bacterium]